MPQIRGIHIPKENNTQNYLINGDMRIAQRNTSFAAIASAAYSLDRYIHTKVGAAVHTVTQDTDVPTLAQAGFLFQNSLRMNLTTPDTSIAAGDYVVIDQKIEGYNWANLAQKPFTLSFWVKATTTGTYCAAFLNNGADRSYVAEYTINATNTWEYKTITVAASPSAGTWNYTNGVGLYVRFALATGSTNQTTAGSWQTGTFWATSNQVNGVNTGSTDFRITGLMLNEGPVAAPFSLYGKGSDQELLACLRYFEKSYDQGTNPATVTDNGAMFTFSNGATSFSFPTALKVVKRTVPTVVAYSPATGATGTARGADGADRPCAAGEIGQWGFNIDNTASNTADIRYKVHFTAEAEL